MSQLTADTEELRKAWMNVYLNLFVLRSTDPAKQEIIESYKTELALTHEKIMDALDKLGDSV